MNTTHLSKIFWLIVLASLLIAPFGSLVAASGEEHALVPLKQSVLAGETEGELTSLYWQDQFVVDDEPSAYLLFIPNKGKHTSERVYQLPSGMDTNKVKGLELKVNIFVPAEDPAQIWIWSIYDFRSQRWEQIGSSFSATPGSWTSLTFAIRAPVRFFNRAGVAHLQLTSPNAKFSAKLDYESLVTSPTPKFPTETPTVTKAPATATPKPTNTPVATSTPKPTSTPTVKPTSTPTSTGCVSYNATFEARVLELINQERAKNGLPALKRQSQLDSAARKHSADMACNNYFSHTGLDGSAPWDRMAREGYSYSWAGENIAAGYSTAESVVTGWMNSSGHRANILSTNFTEIGIGYAYRAASTYGHYWTTTFGKP
jgi:uncharacterized protein YkwD